MSGKRVLALYGSPKRDGPTGAMLDAFCKGLAADTRVEVFDAFARPVRPCTGCGGCERNGSCVVRDGMDEVYRAMEEADGLVIATPVYNLSFPAPLKAVVDRMQCYWSRRFLLGLRPAVKRPKAGALLFTAGSVDKSGGDILERQTRLLMSVLNCRLPACVPFLGTDLPDRALRREPALAAGRRAGEQFFG